MRVLVLVAAVCAAAAVGGCTQTSVGHPVTGPAQSGQAAMTTITTAATSSPSTTEATMPAMGVTTTLRDTVPPNALVCLPTPTAGQPATVQVADPSAPKIVVALPEGWTSAPSPGGLTLTGPDGMTGTVDVGRTTLDPAAA